MVQQTQDAQIAKKMNTEFLTDSQLKEFLGGSPINGSADCLSFLQENGRVPVYAIDFEDDDFLNQLKKRYGKKNVSVKKLNFWEKKWVENGDSIFQKFVYFIEKTALSKTEPSEVKKQQPQEVIVVA